MLSNLPAIAIPFAADNPCPNEPVVISTPGILFISGYVISFYEAINLMTGRLQNKAYKVLTRYALYGEMPPKGTPTRIMQSFVGWKRLIDASSKKYDKAIGDRFAGKTDSKIKR